MHENELTYPDWRCTYSFEQFDRAQAFALEITKAENPKAVAYTLENFDRAEAAVRKAQR